MHQAWGHICVGISGKLFALSLYPTVVLLPLEFSPHIYLIGWSLKLKENPVSLWGPVTTVTARGSVGRGQALCLRSPELGAGGGAGPRAARCALMIVFAEEFWTPHYTIFILFAK